MLYYNEKGELCIDEQKYEEIMQANTMKHHKQVGYGNRKVQEIVKMFLNERHPNGIVARIKFKYWHDYKISELDKMLDELIKVKRTNPQMNLNECINLLT